MRVVMLGAAPETRGSIAAVVDAYRRHGLFRRWPVDYVATRGPGRRPGVALRAAARFAALLARSPRAVVHIHASARAGFWRDCAYAGVALALRCPVILHLHGGELEAFFDALGNPAKAVVRGLLERCELVAVPSQRLAGFLRAVSPRIRTASLPHPVPMPAAQDAPRPNLILFLGRLEPHKGIFDLLEAVARLRAAVPDVRLVCAGEGSRLAVARYAEHLGIADAVKFTGWVGPSGKRALLDSAAVYALPSYAEGMPMGLLEAMAAGMPVIASPVGGMPEVVVDGVTGFLAAPGDIATLERLLRKLLLDRALGARVGAAARETVRLRFSPERALARLEALYAGLGVQPLAAPRRAVEPDLRKAA